MTSSQGAAFEIKASEIAYFSKLPVAWLTTFNRGASFFIHGLVDQHHQVSTTPFIFPLLNVIEDHPASNDPHNCDWVKALEASIEESLRSIGAEFNMEGFSEYYLAYLEVKEHASAQLSIFYAAHFAWSKLNKQNIEDLRIIFWHPHHHNERYERFITEELDCRLIFTSKDPREALVSTYRHWESSPGMCVLPHEETEFIYNDTIFYYLESSLNTYDFYISQRDKSLVIKTEAMNSNPEIIIGGMAEFIGIEVTDNLYTSTVFGQEKDSVSTRGLKGFDIKINVERWQNELPESTVKFIELIHYASIRELDYKPSIILGPTELRDNTKIVSLVLTKIPKCMRDSMFDNVLNDASSSQGRHLAKPLKSIEILLRLLRKYLLLTIRSRSIQRQFKDMVKNQLQI